jgi:hypothetical protein
VTRQRPLLAYAAVMAPRTAREAVHPSIEEYHDGLNTVRFRVKPGKDQEFLDAHKNVGQEWAGLRRANIIKTADHSYCIIAE